MKKLLALVLAVLMVMTVFAACQKAPAADDTKAPVSETKAPEKETEAPEKETEAADSKYPAYLNLESEAPIVKEGEKITLDIVVRREPDNMATSDVNTNFLTQYIEQKLNIDLNITQIDPTVLAEQKSLLMTGGDLPDMMFQLFFTEAEIMQYGVDGGMFLNMYDYVSDELTPTFKKVLEDHPEVVNAVVAPDGALYSAPKIGSKAAGSSPAIGTPRIFIDTKYMDAVGITEAPQTVDEMLDFLRAVKELDPAQFGVDQIVPYIGKPDAMLTAAMGWTSSGLAAANKDFDKKEITIPCMDQEKFTEFVRIYKQMYDEGLLHPDVFTQESMAVNGQCADRVGAMSTTPAPYVNVVTGWEEFISASPLTSAVNNTKGVGASPAYNNGLLVISADTEYPELCMRLVDFLYTDKGVAYGTYGPAAAIPEDNLGLFEGFYYEGTVLKIPEVLNGTYPDNYTFQMNAASMFFNGQMSEEQLHLACQRLAGIENPDYPPLNLEDPDDHYRYLCQEAQGPYVVQNLPSPYADADTMATYGDYKTAINTHVSSELAKFVVGERSMDELPAFFAELDALGLQEYWAMVQELYKDFQW